MWRGAFKPRDDRASGLRIRDPGSRIPTVVFLGVRAFEARRSGIYCAKELCRCGDDRASGSRTPDPGP